MVTSRLIQDSWGKKYALFEVPLPNNTSVFMSVQGTPYNNDKRGVVIVDSEKFLGLWKNDPHNIHHWESHGNPKTWISDRKYPEAVKGFSYGKDNPVPLATISCDQGKKTLVSYKFLIFGKSERQEQYNYVAYTNGVTRTIWLLTQGCKAFPVECEMPSARDLYRVAAVSGTTLYTVEELLKL